MLVVAILSLTNQSFSQEKKKVIPDGTEGEVHEAIDSTPGKKERKIRSSYDLGFTTLKIGGGYLIDYSAYSQDKVGKDQMDSANVELKDGFKVRDSRIALSGKFKTKRTITWKAGFMYDGVSDSWFVRETGIMIGVPELWGSFFIGRTKAGISMSKVMNGYSGEFMERHTALEAIPLLADGVKWLGFLPKKRIFWNVGVFADWLSKGQSFSTHDWQFDARVGWLPMHTDKTNLHVAANFHIGRPQDNSIQVRSKPEASAAPYFIDTKKFPSDRATFLGWEVYYTSGPWMLGTEYRWDKFKSSQKDDPVFHGGELVAGYTITGESRPYYTENAIYGFMPVNKSVFKGGPGAIDIMLRFSTIDLDDGPIKGGKFWRLTPQVNWYATKNIRFEFMYGYGVLDRFNLKGTTQFFQSRLQLAF
jgi:phosphate-selective porin OprO/OprP